MMSRPVRAVWLAMGRPSSSATRGAASRGGASDAVEERSAASSSAGVVIGRAGATNMIDSVVSSSIASGPRSSTAWTWS